MSLETWNNKTRRDDYRKLIRKEAFSFRSELLKCWIDLNVSIPKSASALSQSDRRLRIYESNDTLVEEEDISIDLRQLNVTWLNATLNRSNVHCGTLQDTMIWQKTLAIQRALPWLNLENMLEEKNAYRLLTLEIWCHALSTSRVSRICSRRPDYTARIEYFQ